MLSDRINWLFPWRRRSDRPGRDSGGAGSVGARPRQGRTRAFALTSITVLLLTFDLGAATASDDDPIVVTPSQVQLQVGESVEFSGSSDRFPIVDPHWETDTRFGTISVDPDDPTRCTFTATAPGMGYVILWEGQPRGGSKGSADITVTAGSAQQLGSIVVSPASVNLEVGEQQLFSAVGYDVNGDSLAPPITPVWSTDGGSITQAGAYTAPEVEGTFTVTAEVAGSPVVGRAVAAVSTDTGVPLWVWILVALGSAALVGVPFLIRRSGQGNP